MPLCLVRVHVLASLGDRAGSRTWQRMRGSAHDQWLQALVSYVVCLSFLYFEKVVMWVEKAWSRRAHGLETLRLEEQTGRARNSRRIRQGGVDRGGGQ
jgi:hypothetical protein